MLNCRILKCTFPCALGYAMTGHKSQGATFDMDTIVDMREAFTPGLLYVMLSRVTQRSKLRIVGTGLDPSLFVPVLFDGML